MLNFSSKNHANVETYNEKTAAMLSEIIGNHRIRRFPTVGSDRMPIPGIRRYPTVGKRRKSTDIAGYRLSASCRIRLSENVGFSWDPIGSCGVPSTRAAFVLVYPIQGDMERGRQADIIDSIEFHNNFVINFSFAAVSVTICGSL
jgi:hypothetical protein